MKLPRTTQYTTNATRVFLAFLYASLLASLISGWALSIVTLFSPDHGYGWRTTGDFIDAAFKGTLGALLIWAPCVVLLVGPIWWVFHILNWRHYIHLALLGGSIPFIIVYALFSSLTSSPSKPIEQPIQDFSLFFDIPPFFHIPAFFGAVGLLTGLVIWKVAYRKTD